MEISEELKIFLLESYEMLDNIEAGLLALENQPEDDEQVNQVFRAMHTIKGNSGFLGLGQVEELCHITETLLDKIRNDELKLNSDLVTIMLRAKDVLHSTMQTLESTGEEGQTESKELISELARFLPQA